MPATSPMPGCGPAAIVPALSPLADIRAELAGRLRGRVASDGSERLSWMLAIGAFGLAWPTATIAAYLPPVLSELTGSDTLVGLVLASEGVFALLVPLVVGPLSDATSTPLGARRPYLFVAVLPMAVAAALLASMGTLWSTTALLFAFFFATYVYEPPWRGLYVDLVPPGSAGRAQAASHVTRALAMTGALVAGAFAFAQSRSLPFLLAGLVAALACTYVPLAVREPRRPPAQASPLRGHLAAPWRLVAGDPLLRRFMLASIAWETTFAGMRTFVVLYVTSGLGQPLAVASAVLAVVTAGYFVAAVGLGPFADRLGLGRVILWSSVVYGVGLVAAVSATSWHSWYLAVIALVAVAAGAVTTLSWGLLQKLLPDGDQGAAVGLAVTTRGVGLLAGPPLVGAVVDLTRPLLESTDGYAAVWPVCGLPVLLAIPLVRQLGRAEAALSERPAPSREPGAPPAR